MPGFSNICVLVLVLMFWTFQLKNLKTLFYSPNVYTHLYIEMWGWIKTEFLPSRIFIFITSSIEILALIPEHNAIEW